MDFVRAFRTVGGFLDKSGFRYCLAGGFALHGLGITRATVDVDFVVELRAQPALRAHLRALGYEELHVSDGFSNHVHPDATFGRLDFIYVDETTAERLFAACREAELAPGLKLPVPRPEHLVAMKVLAMKNDPSRTFRELADIQQLLALPEVDVDEVRGYFVQHGLEERFNELERRPAPRSGRTEGD